MEKREKEYLYWLSRFSGAGAVTIRRLYEQYKSFEVLYNIEGTELVNCGLLPARLAGAYDGWKARLSKCREEYAALAPAIRFITPFETEYPARLKQIYDYPMGLYVKGELPPEHAPTVAVVGARGCSDYGRQMARHISGILALEGISIISGLALGTDGAAHQGALDKGCKTYGVLGCGINICYPSSHFRLYECMTKCGGVISEYGPGISPQARNFPMRNRIISGMSDVVLVVEAREKSGSLITAELGLEQGREIFALPGRICDDLSSGCNRLIQHGASILVTPYDIMEYLGLKREKRLKIHKNNENLLAKPEKMVYSCLDLQAKHLEEIVQASGISVTDCMGILLELELKGFVRRTNGQYYGKKLSEG